MKCVWGCGLESTGSRYDPIAFIHEHFGFQKIKILCCSGERLSASQGWQSSMELETIVSNWQWPHYKVFWAATPCKSTLCFEGTYCTNIQWRSDEKVPTFRRKLTASAFIVEVSRNFRRFGGNLLSRFHGRSDKKLPTFRRRLTVSAFMVQETKKL